MKTTAIRALPRSNELYVRCVELWEYHPGVEILLNRASGNCFFPTWNKAGGRRLFTDSLREGDRGRMGIRRDHCIHWSEL